MPAKPKSNATPRSTSRPSPFLWEAKPRTVAAGVGRNAGSAIDRPYREELVDRAALLFRLGVPKAAAQLRLRSYVAWDFEMRGTPAFAQEVDRIVDGVYRRSGPGAGVPNL